jgi:hypothetical protein
MWIPSSTGTIAREGCFVRRLESRQRARDNMILGGVVVLHWLVWRRHLVGRL